MDAAKEHWLTAIYGPERVKAMRRRIEEFRKSLGSKSDDDDFVVGLKAQLDAIVGAAMGAPPTSWEALDSARAAADQAAQLGSVAEDFDVLLSNIRATLPASEQGAAVAALAAGLGDRLALAAAQKAMARDPATGYLDLIAPGLAAVTVAGAKATTRTTLEDYVDLMAAPGRKATKAVDDPWLQMLAVTPIGAA